MRISKFVIIVLMVIAAAAFVFAGEDEKKQPEKEKTFQELVDAAKTAYDKGEYNDAVDHLQAAIKKVQAMQSSDLASAMPDAPEGWAAGEVDRQETQVNEFKSVTATCVYTKKDGDMTRKVEVQIADSPHMVQVARSGILALKGNDMVKPMIEAEGITFFSKDGWEGYVQDKEGTWIKLAVKGDLFVRVEAKKNGDASAVKSFFDAIKWDKLKN